MFHHRFPTSTDNVKNACHPFSTRDFFPTNYVLVHNGHIANASSLKTEHEKLGIVYYSTQPDGSFNDSEALLWDVALYLEGKQDELKAYGGIAFICLGMPNDKRKSTRLYFGRNSNPINMVLNDAMIMLSSEGEGIETTPNTLYTYNYRSHKLHYVPLKINSFALGACYGKPYTTPVGGQPYSWDSDDLDHAEQEKYEEQLIIDATEYDFTILPDSEDYSYESIMGEDMIDLLFENNNGRTLNIKSTIADRLDSYLEAADGEYSAAFDLLRADIQAYELQVMDDAINETPQDDDLILELDILAACKFTMYSSPFWVSTDSVDPRYEDFVTQSVRDYLSKQQQTNLLAA